MPENLINSKQLRRGADQIFEFPHDNDFEAIPPDCGSYTLLGRIGADDGTSNYFVPTITPTINGTTGLLSVPLTRAKSLEIGSTVTKVRLGVWRVDSGFYDALVDTVIEVVNLKGAS